MRKILFAIFATAAVSLLAGYGIRQEEIDETRIYTIKLHPGSVGTLLFPVSDGIEGIHGVNVSKNPQVRADFFVEFIAGTNFISLRATPEKELDPKTPPEKYPAGSLNVVYKKKIIVIKLAMTINPDEADRSVSFVEKRSTGYGRRTVRTTPGTLVSLVDKAKGYELYKRHHPEAIEDVVAALELKQLSVFEDFEIKVQDAFRFDKFDTVILRLFITNKAGTPLSLDTESFAARVGDSLLHASIADCAASIPPHATIPAYIGFTGTEYGGRNNIAPDNQWKVLVSRNTKTQEKIETEKLRVLYNSIGDNMTNEQLDQIEKAINAPDETHGGKKDVVK